MKLALISDLHFNVSKKENILFKYINEFIDYLIDICNRQGVSKMIIAGDLFDTKFFVNTDSLMRINPLMNKLRNNFECYIFPGNHDIAQQNKDTIVSLVDNYKFWDNIFVSDNVIDFSVDDCVFYLLPYVRNVNKSLQSISVDKNKYNVLVSHFGFDIQEILGYEGIDKFSKVFLGHYHGYREFANVVNISSPFQIKHNDEFNKHGFIIFDSVTHEYEFIDNPHTPQFETITFSKEEAKEILKIKDKFLRIVFESEYKTEFLLKIKAFLLKNNYSVDIINNVKGDNGIAINHFSNIIINDAEQLISSYLAMLKKEKKLKYDDTELLEMLQNEV